jgi:hypothetical protein
MTTASPLPLLANFALAPPVNQVLLSALYML